MKQKISDIQSGNIVPSSMKELNSQLFQNDKELQKVLERINELSTKRVTTMVEDAELEKLEQAKVDLTQIISEIKEEINAAKLANPELQELSSKLELMNSKLEQTTSETNQVKDKITDAFNQKNVINFGSSINEIGTKIDKFKTRMTRLIGTVAIFNLLRQGLTSLRNGFISMLKSNDTFNNNLNQIKANLMTAFVPIYNAALPAINTLISALSKLTGTIAVFVANLFGTKLEDAKKQAEGLSSALDKTSKSGKKASGSLASFDNLEVISDSSDDSAGSGSGGGSGIDYSQDIEYSSRLLDFLNRIKDFVTTTKDGIIAFLAGVAGGIAAIKLGCDGFLALGIGLVIGGIVTLIQGIIEFIKDPSWENFATILQGLALILAGVAVAMMAVEGANPVGWIMLAIAAITALVALIIKNWDKIYAWLCKISAWIYDHVIKPIADFFANLWNNLKNGAKNAWEGIKSVFSTVASFFKNIFSNAWEGVKKVFSTGGKIFDGIKEGIVNAFKTVVNAIIRGINKVVSIPFKGINSALSRIKGIDILGLKPFGWISTIKVPQIPELATGTVIPPRHRFAAILGDQRHGTNIEAPLDTIRQADEEAIEKVMNKYFGNLNSQEKELIFRNMTFILQLGNSEAKKWVLDMIRLNEKDMGKPLLVN